MPARKKVLKKQGYSQAEKLAYYKKKAASKYSGYGAYSAPKSAAVGESIGQGFGQLAQFIPGVGPALAAPLSILGKKLGGSLANKLGTYLGWGSYSVNKNSLVVPEGNAPAAMHSDGRVTRICHREYIQDVISSGTAGAFKLDSIVLQPGSMTSFPWLSDIAVNYQKYRILGAIVEYKSGSGDAITGSNTALGEVIISTNYNCADPNFSSRMAMENTQYSSSAKPSVSMVHIIECDPDLQAQENLYVSPSIVPQAGNSPNEINWANVQIATVGCQGTSVNLGSIYITYDIELLQPIEASIYRRPVSDNFYTGSYTNAVPFANAVANPDNSIGGTLQGTQYSFPSALREGLFLVTLSFRGAGVVAAGHPAISGSNINLPIIFDNYSSSTVLAPAAGQATTSMTEMVAVQVTGPNAYFTIGAGTFPTTPAMGQLWITSMDADMLDPN